MPLQKHVSPHLASLKSSNAFRVTQSKSQGSTQTAPFPKVAVIAICSELPLQVVAFLNSGLVLTWQNNSVCVSRRGEVEMEGWGGVVLRTHELTWK